MKTKCFQKLWVFYWNENALSSPFEVYWFVYVRWKSIALFDYLNIEHFTWREIQIVWFASVHSHVGTHSVKYSIYKKKHFERLFFNIKFIYTGYNIIHHTLILAGSMNILYAYNLIWLNSYTSLTIGTEKIQKSRVRVLFMSV